MRIHIILCRTVYQPQRALCYFTLFPEPSWHLSMPFIFANFYKGRENSLFHVKLIILPVVRNTCREASCNRGTRHSVNSQLRLFFLHLAIRWLTFNVRRRGVSGFCEN